MKTANGAPHVFIIDPTDDKPLRSSLASEYGLVVDHSANVKDALMRLQQARPDLIVLNARMTAPSASMLLAEFTTRQITSPIVLIGANGETTRIDADFDNSNIVGWLNPPYTADELASLIYSALERPLVNNLVLAKRIELIEANQQLTQRLRELNTLFEIGKSVTSLLDLEAILHLVVKAGVTLTGAEESYLLLVDEVSGDLYLRAEANMGEEEAKNFWVKTSDSIAGQVVKSGKAVILSRENNSLKIKTGLTVYSLVNVPVKVGQNVIGLLGISNRHEKRAFSKHDQELLAALADWAAIAIQNAKLYATARAHSRDLELINDVGRLVSSTLDVEQIPRLLIQRTVEIFEAECGSLALADEEKGGVIFQIAYDGQGNEIKRLKNFLMPFGEGIIGLVAQTCQPYLANDVTQDPNWSSLVDRLTGFTTEKVMAVPLVAEGETLGVMEVLNKKEGDFNQDDLKLLSLVAASAAIAIKNARQYAALKTANEALRQAQAQRIASERWTVLGQAAGNLAHRINNSTALVPLVAQHLRRLLQQVEMSPELRLEVADNLDRIERNTLYTVELAMALLRRFRKIPAEAHKVNVLIEQALALVEIPENIRLVRQLEPDLPSINTSDLLTDVFVELITNAIRAMDNRSGILRIASFKVANSVSIQVTDNGTGISADNLERVFDMFFTTNPRGLGFGLWWVKAFLEQQRGQIMVESQPNQGTTFTVTLSSPPTA